LEYRDDRAALRDRADSLEDELAEANERLKAARESLAASAEKDQRDEQHLAELEEQLNELRRRLGLPPERVISKPKKESSAAGVVVLLGLSVFALMLAVGVVVFGVLSPGGGEPPAALLLVVAGAFALFGLPLMGLALSTFAKDRAIARWPRSQGKILSSRIETSTSTERDDRGYNRRVTRHSPVVSYSYVVDGTEYEGNAVARSVAMTTNRTAVQACIDRYAAGKEVMVLYDPKDPTTAYLEVRRSWGAFILLGFGGLLAAIGVVLAVVYFRT
jgi:hypothetical protein